MMETIIAIAGAVQLTRCIMALIEALEKPSAPPPTKARHRSPISRSVSGLFIRIALAFSEKFTVSPP